MKRTLSAIMAFALGICSTPGVSTPVAESDARSANLYYSMTMDEDGNWKEVPEYKPFKQSEENQDEVSFYPYTFTKDGGSETVASVRLQPLLMDNMYYGTSIDLGEGSGAVIASPVVTEVDMDFESSMLRAEVSSYDNKTELFSCCLLCPEDNASDKVKESEGPVKIKDGVTYYVLSMAYVAKDEPEEVTITDNGLTVNAYMEYYVSEAAINSFSKGDLLYFGMTSLDNNEQPSEMSALLPVRYGMKALTKTDYAVVTTDNVPINTDLETEFTGSAVRPEVIVLGLEESGVVLKKGEDYTASFSNNIHAGTARVTIAGVGDYYGNITAQFTVSPATITANNTEVSFAEEEYVYSGVAVTPEMSVVYRGEAGNITLNKGTDYSQVYSNNTAPGQAVVTINGTGDFTGNVEARFTITAPPEVYTISFDAGGGSGEMANVTVIEGNTFALPECSFTAPAKHEFYEWTLGEPGANVTITGNTTITALWKQLPPEEYTVSFDAGEGSGEMANVTVIEGNTFALPECSFTAPAKHEFYKW
ncbi:MAG: InlB B-repeat-containing protein, partial [Lachnospiraceae bacterium]|nr:InlB B-repeat-containing protein [Lachnospiraceae bacterium]